MLVSFYLKILLNINTKKYINKLNLVFCCIFFRWSECNITSRVIASKFRKLVRRVLFLAKAQLVCTLCSLVYPLMNITLIHIRT